MGPAYRIVTPRLVIRSWQPEDAVKLKEAIDSSVEHLRPWLPWAQNEPEPLERKHERIRRWRGDFDLGLDFIYGVFDRAEERVLGGTGLHNRVGPDAREIGYWVRADSSGQGIATEFSAALTRVAFEVDRVSRVEIHVVVGNQRSAAVPRKLGYLHEATLRRPHPGGGSPLYDTMIWTMFADRYPKSAAASQVVEAYGFGGERLL
ncbi:MAG TPA: GNAT family protein [Terriglobales bacterium]|jgi:RimJ/RimL family protein N-acetyltransferase|nr:GNAT family protein [Terriglobales bacterium]